MSTALKVIIVIALVIVGTVAMLSVAGLIFAKHVHVQETGPTDKKTVRIDTPFGNMMVHENNLLDPEHVGVPIYPGAVRTGDKGGADLEFDAGELHKDLTVAAATYITDDSPDKVRAFYMQKLPGWKNTWKDGNFNIEAKADGRIRSVSIKQEAGHTRIGVASVGPPAAN